MSFVLNGTLIPTLPADTLLITNTILQRLAIICFIAGFATCFLAEKAAEIYRAKKEECSCNSN